MNVEHALPILVSILVLSGCGVSRDIVAEKDALLTDVERKLATCEDTLAIAERKNQDALAAIADRERELAACREGQRVSEDSLAVREAELRERLAAELARKDVEIERLRDSLALRVLDRILFASGSARIRDAGSAVLDKIAVAIRDSDEYLRVEGHTDDVPIGAVLKRTYPTNWELSGARAASVVRHFQDNHAIEPERLEAVGHSMYQPVVSNDSEENRQRNRRVELVLTKREL